jgi:cation-transporting P-type ATPase 13A2
MPENYDEVLELYTKEGYRVIALAEKPLPGINMGSVMSVTRDDVESDLNFLGLLIMENKLKPQTIGTIKEL